MQREWSASRRQAARWLAGCGLGSAAVWLAALLLVARGENPLLIYNGAYFVAFLGYLIAALVVLRDTVRGPLIFGLIVVLALLPRLILVWSTPALSDDLYRYIWDGKVILTGRDPYRYPPAAPELADLRTQLWEPINQKTQRTPYPPAAEAVFALTYAIAPDSVKAQQVVALLGDLAVCGALLLLLGRLNLPRERLLLYAWHPTPLLHFAHSAHNDALMIAGVVLALAFVCNRAPAIGPSPGGRIGGGMALAFAGLVKLVPFLLAPLLLRRWRWPGALAFAATLLLGIAPFARAGLGLLGGLGTEAGEAVFNDSLHYLLVRLLAPVVSNPGTAVSLIALGVLGVAALLLALRGGNDLALIHGAMILIGLVILLNAVVEPWYLAWMLPFVAVLLRRGPVWWRVTPLSLPGWLWLSGAAQLTDLTYLGPEMARWWPVIRLVEYAPLFLLLALAGVRLVVGLASGWRRDWRR